MSASVGNTSVGIQPNDSCSRIVEYSSSRRVSQRIPPSAVYPPFGLPISSYHFSSALLRFPI